MSAFLTDFGRDVDLCVCPLLTGRCADVCAVANTGGSRLCQIWAYWLSQCLMWKTDNTAAADTARGEGVISHDQSKPPRPTGGAGSKSWEPRLFLTWMNVWLSGRGRAQEIKTPVTEEEFPQTNASCFIFRPKDFQCDSFWNKNNKTSELTVYSIMVDRKQTFFVSQCSLYEWRKVNEKFKIMWLMSSYYLTWDLVNMWGA